MGADRKTLILSVSVDLMERGDTTLHIKISQPILRDSSKKDEIANTPPATAPTKKRYISNTPLGTAPQRQSHNFLKRMSNKNQVTPEKELAVSVARQMDKGTATNFLARHSELLNQLYDPLHSQSSYQTVTQILAEEFGMTPQLTGRVVTVLNTGASQAARQPETQPLSRNYRQRKPLPDQPNYASTGDARKTLHVTFATDNENTGQSSVSRSTKPLAADEIDILRDIYLQARLKFPNSLSKARIQAKNDYYAMFPDAPMPTVNRQLRQMRDEELRQASNPVQTNRPPLRSLDPSLTMVLREIYEHMRGTFPDNHNEAQEQAKTKFKEMFPQVGTPEIEWQLRLMHEEATKLMQPGAGRNTSVRENNNDAQSSVSRNTAALSADQIDTLANTYEHWRREFPDSPTMARMNAKIDFFKMLGQLPVSAEMLAATNQQLLLIGSEEVKSTPDSESRNTVVRSSASRNKAQLSAEQIDTLRDIYRSMRQNTFSPFEARINAKVAFSGIFLGLPVSEDMLNAINEQLRRMSSEELAPKPRPEPRNSENASVAIHGPKQGDVVVTDRTRVYCGKASPLPVNPGQPFYREKQIKGACSQHALNALVGFNAFDMQYIENVKRDVFVKTLGMSVDEVKAMEDAGSGDTGQDPEILAECLRRKAQAGEIDPKWRNAIANVSVEVNDELWSHLEQQKLNGLIIGRSDNSHYVTQRTDLSGQDRILNSLKTQEINMTTQQYIESLLHEMPATANGKKTVHFITCPPVGRTVIPNT